MIMRGYYGLASLCAAFMAILLALVGVSYRADSQDPLETSLMAWDV